MTVNESLALLAFWIIADLLYCHFLALPELFAMQTNTGGFALKDSEQIAALVLQTLQTCAGRADLEDPFSSICMGA